MNLQPVKLFAFVFDPGVHYTSLDGSYLQIETPKE